MVESKYIGSDSSPNPCLLKFNMRLKSSMLGMIACQTHVYLGSTRGQTQVGSDSLSDLYVSGLPLCY